MHKSRLAGSRGHSTLSGLCGRVPLLWLQSSSPLCRLIFLCALYMMSTLNALVGCACGAVFMCDWLVARSRSPRALLNAKRRREYRPYTDEGHHPMPSEEDTPLCYTIGAMKHEEFAKLRNSLFVFAPGTSSVCICRNAFISFNVLL